MPNNVTNRIVISGPVEKLRQFVKKQIVEVKGEEEEEERLDFNLILPMPTGLKEAKSGSVASVAYQAWYGNLKSAYDYGWIKDAGIKRTRKALQTFLLKRDPQAKEQADLYKTNIEKYGFPTWYEWAIANWGTKWDSYGFRWTRNMGPRDWGNSEIEFTIDTAWSPPEPIFQKLSEMWPLLHFKVASFDEQWNFACEGEFEAGEGGLNCEDATKEMYERVYGVPAPPEDASEEP